jgi:YbgC/YbaW family acyl-CoA thioester hydrolase
MMSKVFVRRFRVRWSEIDANGQVMVANYLRYLVETALDWGATGQLGADDIDALGQIWVIRETEFNFVRPLCYNDVFEFAIWLVKWHRVRGTRAFELKLEGSGEVVAQGVQQVACLDGETMRPTSPPEQIIEHFRIDNPRVFALERFPRVSPAPEAAFVMQRQVEVQDVDASDIVNNAVYAAYAEEAAARALSAVGWSPAYLKSQGLAIVNRRLHIQYQSPAFWGDKLKVITYLLELGNTGGSRYVSIERAGDRTGIAECIMDWLLVDQVTGEAQPLPLSLSIALREEVVVTF